MTIKEAIKKATKAGYEHSFRVTPCEMDGITFYHIGDTLLDPLFWQSLGKALGCEGRVFYPHEHRTSEGMEKWKWYWHRFIDHLAEGKSVESFFESL